MSSTLVIDLGGQQYEIPQLPYAQARAWRQRFEEQVSPIIGAMGALQGIDLSAIKETSLEQIAALVYQIGPTLIGAPDLIAEMVLTYAAPIASDRARIESTATDTEFIRAFKKVLGQMYPLDLLMESLGAMKPGTSQNSRVPRGVKTPTA